MQLASIKNKLKRKFNREFNLTQIAQRGGRYVSGPKFIFIRNEYDFAIGDLDRGDVEYYSTNGATESYMKDLFKKDVNDREADYYKDKLNPAYAYGPVKAARYIYVAWSEESAKELKSILSKHIDDTPYLAAHHVTWINPKSLIFAKRVLDNLMAKSPDSYYILIGTPRFKLDIKLPNVIQRPKLEQWPIDLRNDFVEIQALGSTVDHFFYASNYKNGILKMGPVHNHKFILALAPKKYWEDMGCFWLTRKDGRQVLDFDAIGVYLMELSSKVGQYDETCLQGSGYYWNQDTKAPYCRSGMVTVGLPPEGTKMGYEKEIYVPRRPDGELNIRFFTRIFDSFCWRESFYGRVLLGWCLLAPFCGAIRFRPHVWVNGEKASGKTWIFTNVVSPMLEDLSVTFSMNTTEAGLMGRLGGCALPLVHDEFEARKQDTNSNKQKIIEFLRGCSTADAEGDFAVVRYTPGGARLRKSRAASMALLGSIKNSLRDPQDVSRFLTLNLSRNKRKAEFRDIKVMCECDPKRLRDMFRLHVDIAFRSFGKIKDLIATNEHKLMELYPETTFHSLRAIAAVQSILEFYKIGLTSENIKFLVDKFNSDDIRESNKVMDDLFLTDFWHYGRRVSLHSLLMGAFERKRQRKDDDFYGPELKKMGVRFQVVDGKTLEVYISTKNRLFMHHIEEDNLPKNWKSILAEESNVTLKGYRLSVLDYFKYLGGKDEDNKGKEVG